LITEFNKITTYVLRKEHITCTGPSPSFEESRLVIQTLGTVTFNVTYVQSLIPKPLYFMLYASI